MTIKAGNINSNQHWLLPNPVVALPYRSTHLVAFPCRARVVQQREGDLRELEVDERHDLLRVALALLLVDARHVEGRLHNHTHARSHERNVRAD